jgi:hypothetical protein
VHNLDAEPFRPAGGLVVAIVGQGVDRLADLRLEKRVELR